MITAEELELSFGFFSLLPPLIAILLALVTRQVHLSLLAGLYVGACVWVNWNPLRALEETGNLLLDVFESRSNTMVVFFCLLVGGLLALGQRSGGVEGFVKWMQKWKFAQTRGGAQMMAWVVGLMIFVESSISCLVVGAISRPLFDGLKLSREKLAYICDTTSAPVCMLIPLNGWGALVVGLLEAQQVLHPVLLLVRALPLTFYAIAAVLAVPILVFLGDFGPMARAERRAREKGKVLRDGAVPMVSEELVGLAAKPGLPARALYLVFPILVMVALIPLGLYVTGGGDLLKGSGSTSVFWAVSLAVLLTSIVLLLGRVFRLAELVELILKGSAGLLPVTILVVLAFAIGILCDRLQTGEYAAGLLSRNLSPALLPGLTFLVSAFISFSTGTSWVTFSILIPVAIPAASSLGVALPLTLGAVLSGGVFGDHASPLSDTTIISSLGAASDHVDHTNTQLPYALLGALLAVVLYFFLGWWR